MKKLIVIAALSLIAPIAQATPAQDICEVIDQARTDGAPNIVVLSQLHGNVGSFSYGNGGNRQSVINKALRLANSTCTVVVNDSDYAGN